MQIVLHFMACSACIAGGAFCLGVAILITIVVIAIVRAMIEGMV